MTKRSPRPRGLRVKTSSGTIALAVIAMQMTGHKTRSVFQRYNIVSAGDLREAAKRLDAVQGQFQGQSSQIGDRGRKSEIRKSLCDNR